MCRQFSKIIRFLTVLHKLRHFLDFQSGHWDAVWPRCVTIPPYTCPTPTGPLYPNPTPPYTPAPTCMHVPYLHKPFKKHASFFLKCLTVFFFFPFSGLSFSKFPFFYYSLFYYLIVLLFLIVFFCGLFFF